MSKLLTKPILIPKDVDVAIVDNVITVKGGKGSLSRNVPKSVIVEIEQQSDHKVINCRAEQDFVINNKPMTGTMYALIKNMVIGVTEGFTKQLELVGVGYRAQVQNKQLNLSLGFSHPVRYTMPTNVTVDMPSNTVIVLKSSDKQALGQVAAEIRSLRPPESYKGKGIKYSNEKIVIKETKKK